MKSLHSHIIMLEYYYNIITFYYYIYIRNLYYKLTKSIDINKIFENMFLLFSFILYNR